ncbi:di-heme oxidoredictase family protein [Telmatospirillum sp. J64-1]|uniref:di-heme oxidoreductase family protein n=1 Tax=Telmatospirillum sp. J64-1 TaxID=2502183 RepID=UPI00210741EE|nr:di-heme oxidoredictase family protein [Telmatospirillum sp. J64-1]
MRHLIAASLVVMTALAPALALDLDFSAPEPGEEMQGGATTHAKLLNRDAFSHPSANMSFAKEMDFKIGNGFFRRLWVTAPSSTKAADGLGPLFNARGCQNCHLKDGRGKPPASNDEDAVSMFLRLSIPPQNEEQRALLESRRVNVIPEPVYGGQLQNFSLAGHVAEGRMVIEYEEIPVELSEGEQASLRKPAYSIANLGYGEMHPEVMISPRIAPPMIGLGLLEAIPEEAILALADPDDADGDGISGKPQRVWSLEEDRVMLGRFGWKAGTPSVAQQSAEAFAGDMGLSTPLVPLNSGDCTPAQQACLDAPHGGDPQYDGYEVPQEVLDLVSFYARNLALPPRRDVADPQVLHGKRVFHESGCAACHTPSHVTAVLPDRPEQSGQKIWPYTDLLLHDMGEGLADNRPEGAASGSEWRTAPLWGIGLTETVNGHTYLLHDGRARDVLEAVLWHGGEAQAARDRVIAMPKADRDALLRFLNSL